MLNCGRIICWGHMAGDHGSAMPRYQQVSLYETHAGAEVLHDYSQDHNIAGMKARINVTASA